MGEGFLKLSQQILNLMVLPCAEPEEHRHCAVLRGSLILTQNEFEYPVHLACSF